MRCFKSDQLRLVNEIWSFIFFVFCSPLYCEQFVNNAVPHGPRGLPRGEWPVGYYCEIWMLHN